MNMNMSRPSMLWLYGLIGAFIIGYYVFGDVNDTPVSSDWTTVEQMVEKGEVEKILIVNRDQAQVIPEKGGNRAVPQGYGGRTLPPVARNGRAAPLHDRVGRLVP